MIAFLEGVLVEKAPARAVLNVGGVGYELTIPLSSYDRLPDENQSCRLLVCESIREDAHDLYGFVTAEERRMFQLLVGVSGIGPKTAVSALSGLPVRELKAAVVQGDVKRLSSISGIGKKTAERLVVELKDKIGAGEALEAVAGPAPVGDLRLRDTLTALIALGFKQAEAQILATDAAQRLGRDAGVEELVRDALARR